MNISWVSLMMEDKLIEVAEKQSMIISAQSSIINELFQLLCQHMTVEELENVPAVRRIELVAQIRAETEV